MNQTKARDAIGRIMNDPEKISKWNNRPPTSMQNEFFRFFGLPIPKGLTYDEIEKEINKIAYDQSEQEDLEWDAFVSIYDDLSDAEFRRDEDIKAVSLKMFRDYVATKREQGIPLESLDSYEVVEELRSLHPDIER